MPQVALLWSNRNICFAVPTARASSQIMMHDRGDSTNVLVPAGCCHDHGQRRKSAASSPCSGPYVSIDLRCFSCAIHDPWKCVHENIERRKLCGLLLFKCCILNCLVASMILACSCICIFEQCAYAGAVSIPDQFYCNKICPLIPNSWFRSFCRTRFQTRRDSAAELGDTDVASKYSGVSDRSQLYLWLQRDAHDFGSRLRLTYKPPRECQCDSC